MWFFSKMFPVSQASLMGTPLSSYSGRLPKWGSMRSGDIFALQTWARPTSANGGSAWPTPKKADGDGGPQVAIDGRIFGLSGAIKLWSTLQAQMAKHAQPTKWEKVNRPRDLHVQIWGTPRAADHKGSGPRGSKSQRHMEGRRYLAGQAATPETGALNPAFVETLMGYPIGWTDLDGPPAPANPSTPGNRRAWFQHRHTAQRGSRRSETRSCPRSFTRSPVPLSNIWKAKRRTKRRHSQV